MFTYINLYVLEMRKVITFPTHWPNKKPLLAPELSEKIHTKLN